MTTCPKCGSGNISGPRYQPCSGWRDEQLLYTCCRCGFQRSTPTRDAKPTEALKEPISD